LHALSSVLHPCRPDLSINDTPTTQIYTLSLHDALPISVFPTTTRTDPPQHRRKGPPRDATAPQWLHASTRVAPPYLIDLSASNRSEERRVGKRGGPRHWRSAGGEGKRWGTSHAPRHGRE